MKDPVKYKQCSYNCRRDLCIAAVMVLCVAVLAIWQIGKGSDRGTPSPPHLGGIYLTLDNMTKAVLYRHEGAEELLIDSLIDCGRIREADSWKIFLTKLKEKEGRN